MMSLSKTEELFKPHSVQVWWDLIDISASDACKWMMKGEDPPINALQYKLAEFFFFFLFSDLDELRYNTHLDLPLGGNTSLPWFVGVYSSCGPLEYTLKAWCSSMSFLHFFSFMLFTVEELT